MLTGNQDIFCHCLGFLTKGMHHVQKMLDEDEDISAVRAADGRGPLFWAHEAKNDDAIELLKVNHRAAFQPSALRREFDVIANLHACTKNKHNKP